jgi:hypothetical protein
VNSRLDKRKYLLAGLSLHMVQAALQKEETDVTSLRRYLFSLLTICEDVVPNEGLSLLAGKLVIDNVTQSSLHLWQLTGLPFPASYAFVLNVNDAELPGTSI